MDLRRETLFHEIEQCSRQLIEEIALSHKECLELAKTQTSAAKNIDAIKVELDEQNAKFDSFVIHDIKNEEYLLKCSELNQKLNPEIEVHKRGLLRKQIDEFIPKEVKISEIFGTLFEVNQIYLRVFIKKSTSKLFKNI